ncbi:MAG: type II toxin-antitoxin system RatA family toxin [Gammaproteobacteria bacterium]
MTYVADENHAPAATYSERRVMPYRAEQIFDLVADVEHYPQFLPMWEEARIVEHGRNVYHTDQVVRIGLLRTRFRSQTRLSRPRRIEITSSEGLFRHFSIRWHFARLPRGKGCQVDCDLVWEVRSPLLQSLLQLVLVEAGQGIVTAFEQRAHELYGEKAAATAAPH